MFCSGYGCRTIFFQGGERMQAEVGVGKDLVEIGWSTEVESGVLVKLQFSLLFNLFF